LGYLWTRVYLTNVFSRAEQEARQRPEYYEGLMHAFLYQPKPGGFERAIETGEEYNRMFDPSSVRVWEYLACAYGQNYYYLQHAPSPDTSKLAEVRRKALDAVQRAIQIEPDSAAAFLYSLWDPAVAADGEDDLTPFYGDAEFAAIFAKCGRQPKSGDVAEGHADGRNEDHRG